MPFAGYRSVYTVAGHFCSETPMDSAADYFICFHKGMV